MSGGEKKLNKAKMIELFNEIGGWLKSQGKSAEIAVYGGSAIALSFGFRDATSDVDYSLVSGDFSGVESFAKKIGEREGLEENWLNDAVQIFLSDNPDFRLFGEYPPGGGALRVFTASPEYVLSMKMMALRSSIESEDAKDIWELMDICDVKSIDDAMDFFKGFYPGQEIPVRNRLVMQDLIKSKQAGEEYNRMLAW